MHRGVGSLLLLPIIAGCGADSGVPAAETNADRPFSARFSERTTFADGRVRTTRGAFDWDAMRGWAEEERTPGGVTRTVQTGNVCFERVGNGPWKRSQASDPEGTCSFALFGSPKSEFELLQEVAGLEAVGKAEIRGTQTTHYQGVLGLGAVQGTIEVWVDEAGVVRRDRQIGEGDSFTETRDYYDFGADVTVQPPNLSS
jgi:hypothetical protein